MAPAPHCGQGFAFVCRAIVRRYFAAKHAATEAQVQFSLQAGRGLLATAGLSAVLVRRRVEK